MPKTIFAETLTEAAYRPYGGIISTSLDKSKAIQTAAGHSYLEIVPTENHYASAPSGKPGKAVTNLAIVFPQPGVVQEYHDPLNDALNRNAMAPGGAKRVVRIDKLERHKYTTQTFIPMSNRTEKEGKYLVVVTDAREEGPDVSGLKAWVAGVNEGVCYGVGVWHAGMCVIDETMVFGQVQHSNGVQNEDVEYYPLEEVLEIVF